MLVPPDATDHQVISIGMSTKSWPTSALTSTCTLDTRRSRGRHSLLKTLRWGSANCSDRLPGGLLAPEPIGRR